MMEEKWSQGWKWLIVQGAGCASCVTKKRKEKKKKYIQAFKQLCNLFHASKSANANWIQWLTATKQVQTSRGRIIWLNPTQNSKLIKTFSDTRALSPGLYEQVCCVFSVDFSSKGRTFRDKSESVGLFGREKRLLWRSSRAVQTVCFIPLVNWVGCLPSSPGICVCERERKQS